MIKYALKDFLEFIRRPNDFQISLNFKSKVYLFITLFFFYSIFTTFILLPILSLILEINDIYESNSSLFTFCKTLTVLVLLIPFIEELVFRYFLRYGGIKTVIVSREKWIKFFPMLVYLSTICFALLHITNLSFSSKIFFLLIPILVLPQLIGGIIITYLRVRLNFFWGLLFHFLWNFLVFIIIPYCYYFSDNGYSIGNSNYSIFIKQELFFDKDEQSMKIDSFSGTIRYIDLEQYTIEQLLDTLNLEKINQHDDQLINLKFESAEGVTKNYLKEIIKKSLQKNLN